MTRSRWKKQQRKRRSWKKQQPKRRSWKKKERAAAAASRRRSGSVDDIFFLPQELFFHLLKGLPAKSLLRFRTVCKLWCSIIDNPSFVEHHLARSHTRPDGIKLFLIKTLSNQSHNYDVYRVDMSCLQVTRTLNYQLAQQLPCDSLQYVKGLVCFRDLILNPATNQSIPFPPLDLPPYMLVPLRSRTIMFGASDNDYKVLLMCYPASHFDLAEFQRFPPGCKVWTVGTCAWRDFDVSIIPSDFRYLYDHNDYLCAIGDVIYCLGCVGFNNPIQFIIPGKWRIFAFDVRQEKLLHILRLPDFFSRLCCLRVNAPKLIDARGHLGLVDSQMNQIFILGENGCWRYVQKLQLPPDWRAWHPTRDPNFPDEGFMRVAGSLPTGDVLFRFTMIDRESKLKRTTYFCYDPVDQKTSKFTRIGGGGLQPPMLLGKLLLDFSYAESVLRLCPQTQVTS